MTEPTIDEKTDAVGRDLAAAYPTPITPEESAEILKRGTEDADQMGAAFATAGQRLREVQS